MGEAAVQGGLKRLYVVEFDSLSQQHLVSFGQTRFGADAVSSFVAMMRLADLLSETGRRQPGIPVRDPVPGDLDGGGDPASAARS